MSKISYNFLLGSMTKNKPKIIHDFDPVWDEKYKSGHAERYPWDSVVSFIYKYVGKTTPRSSINILEVGFGSGANLWFAAREGFNVYGIEGSEHAVKFAQCRFDGDGLKGELLKGNFTDLPFEDEFFDVVINRASLCCVDFDNHNLAITEIHRVMKKNAKFFYSGYSVSHSSYTQSNVKDSRLVSDIAAGSLQGIGQILFLSEKDLYEIFINKWNILSMNKIDTIDVLKPDASVHSDWMLTLEKL
jgi:SAM-dependent methyltransferase